MKFRLMAALLAGTSIFAAQAHAEPVKIGIANFGPIRFWILSLKASRMA